MAIGNIYNAKININGPEGPWSFSIGYKQTGGTNGPDTLTALGLELTTILQPELINVLSFNHLVESIEVTQVDTGNDIPGQVDFPNGIGNIEFGALPNTAPVLILWKTIAPNAKYNGKTYVSGVPRSEVTNGILESTYIDLLDLLIVAVLADISLSGDEDADFVTVVISRYEDGVKRPEPIGYEMESGAANSVVKNQRRRRTRNKGIPAF